MSQSSVFTNMYIMNIHSDFDDDKLLEPFGFVASSEVRTDGKDKGFVFVRFKDHKAAYAKFCCCWRAHYCGVQSADKR